MSAYESGMLFDTANNGKLKILEYRSWDNVLVEFEETGYVTETRSWLIKTGVVRDNLKPSVYGFGFIGDGDYKVKVGGKLTVEYKLWQSMLGRCYAPVWDCYQDCAVDVKWHNFQVFAKWYESYAYTKVGWQLDKDILGGDNKRYSEETCSFVPQEINACVTEKPKSALPRGVTFRGGRYRSGVSVGGKRQSLGTFDTAEEAHEMYKTSKKSVILGLAEKHRAGLHPDTYDALINWIV